MKVVTLTDWRGRPYSIGTRVVVPRMSGRSVEMTEGTVIKITAGDDGNFSITLEVGKGSRWHRGSGVKKKMVVRVIENVTVVASLEELAQQAQEVVDGLLAMQERLT